MRQLITLLLALLTATNVGAATKMYGTDQLSFLTSRATQSVGQGCVSGPPWDYNYYQTTTSAPASAQSNLVAYTSTAPPCIYQDNGPFMFWVSPPLSGTVTIAGNVSAVTSGVESSASLNSGVRVDLWKFDARRGGLTVRIWTGNSGENNSGSCLTKSITASDATDTAMAVGDRFIIMPFVIAAGGSWGGNGSRQAGLCYGSTGNNEFSVSVNESVTFSADNGAASYQEQLGWLDDPFWPIKADARRAYERVALPLFWQPRYTRS